ncbi:MAG: CDP-glycerol glycerophosphotransferase family protein [Idiomarina sp.]|nr:CDP-glycerol glycerophosphotransferase family protein [Idiomarina sp.]
MINDGSWIIFGASKRGETAIAAEPQRQWIGFIDNDSRKWGTEFCGLPVMSLETYLKNHAAVPIVIASQYQMEIIEQLIENGIQHFQLYWPVFRSKLEQNDTSDDFQTFNLEGSADIQKGRLALFIRNNSGSNTLALKKMKVLESSGLNAVFHHDMVKSNAYIEDLLKSEAVVVTHDKTVRSDVKSIQLWHGFPMKGLNYMSRFQPPETRELTRQRWLKYAAVTSYSATYTSLMNACYGIHAEQYQVTGMPRNDLLFAPGAEQKLEQLVGKKLNGRQVILYMPTFRKTMYGQVNGDGELGMFGLPNFDRDEFFKYLETNQLVLVVKPHPYHEDDFGLGNKDDLPENVWVITDQPLMAHEFDFYEMLAAADLLITDYSSVYFDYLLLDKPMVFTPSDSQEYKETRGFLIEPYEFWAPGPKCYQQQSLQTVIMQQLDNPGEYAQERERVTAIVHEHRDNESSLRVAKLITQIMDNEE